MNLVILSQRGVISKVRFIIMSIYIDFNTCRTVSVDTFNKILISDMIINDTTMWHDYIYIYWVPLYDDLYIYEGFTGFHTGFFGDDYVAMRPLWIDLWKGHIRA